MRTPRRTARIQLVICPGDRQSASGRIDGKRGEAAEAELLEAQPRPALRHIQRIAPDVVVNASKFGIGEGAYAVSRAREHDLIPRNIAGLVALVSDVNGPIRRSRWRRALVEGMGGVADLDRVRPGDAVIMRHSHHDVRRKVAARLAELE